MSKIKNLINTLKSGARSNKYRLLVPTIEISRSLDVMCHAAALPGRVITPVDVTIKGKKTQIIGETSLSGSWTVEFYNDSEMVARRYFTQWMEDMHSLTLKNQGDGYFKKLDTLSGLVLNEINSLKDAVKEVKAIVKDPTQLLLSGVAPEYQKDIKIQQLGNSENVILEATIIGAFPINVEDIQLDDSTSEISSTSVTFAFSDVIIGNSVEKQAVENILGDRLGGLIS